MARKRRPSPVCVTRALECQQLGVETSPDVFGRDAHIVRRVVGGVRERDGLGGVFRNGTRRRQGGQVLADEVLSLFIRDVAAVETPADQDLFRRSGVDEDTVPRNDGLV